MTARTARRAALTLASTALMLGGLAGCGGSDGGSSGSAAPDHASKDDFCRAFNGLFAKVVSEAGSGDTSRAIGAMKAWAADMQAVGTPSDMPDDARHGFEVFVAAARKIDADASLSELTDFGSTLPQGDQADAEAFGAWASTHCPGALSDLSSALPSEIASSLPSDLPSSLASQLPSDLPTDPSELASMMSELTASAGG